MHALVFLAILLLLGGILAAGVVLLLAVSLLRPPRMTDGKALWVLRRLSPGDLGLAFEEMKFQVREERTGRPLGIAGWWIARAASARPGRCVVFIHGYADAKVGAIAWAPTWHALGYNILAVDLRGHGESGGTECTAGYFERHDIDAVLNSLRAQRPAETEDLVLFGISLGAAVAAAVAVLREDLAAVVLESPFADFASAAMLHMDWLGAPGKIFQRAALHWAQRLSGADFGAVRPVDGIAAAHCPVMVISPAEDSFLATDASRAAMSSALRPERGDILWRPDESGHLGAMPTNPQEYQRRLAEFLQSSALRATASSSSREPARV